MKDFVLTSEAMTAGHPDKLCDQISDAMIDACLMASPPIGCNAECAIASGIVFLSIRHGPGLEVDPADLARRVLGEAGYPEAEGPGRTTVMLDLVEAAELEGPIAAEAMRTSHMTTAFGYACDQTAERLPWPIWAAHRIRGQLEQAIGKPPFTALTPDAEVQVAVRFAERRPVALAAVALNVFTTEASEPDDALAAQLRARVVAPALEAAAIRPDAATRFVVRRVPGAGGSKAHAGLTGRKVANDTYGGFVRQSSSALSGKDPSRIDRIAAYAARQAAVSAVAAGLARECEVQLSYVAGDREPISFEVDSFATGIVPDPEIAATLAGTLDFRIGAIVERLALWDLPRRHNGRFYRDLARATHVGRSDLALPWDVPVTLR
jgi:S-adenosylmethionine synthetase